MALRAVLRVTVPVDEAELAADALWALGPSAVVVEDLGAGQVALVADVRNPSATALRWPGEVVEVDEGAALDAWRAHAAPVRAGRLLLQPAWLPQRGARPEDVVVRLDPGRAFGSGSHPSTRLALGALEAHVRGGERLLDVGCGSGVLAVAGCLLGAQAATAIDVDGAAVVATSANARANGVADRVDASTTPLAELEGAYDVVVANIGARALADLRDDLVARTAAGGLVVLAGFLDEQARAVAAAYSSLVEVERGQEDGWTALTLRR